MAKRKCKWKREHEWDGPDVMFIRSGYDFDDVYEEFKGEPGCSRSMLQKRCANRTASNKLGEGWVQQRKKFETKLKAEQLEKDIKEIIRTRKRHRSIVQFGLGKAAIALGYPLGQEGVDILQAMKTGLPFEKASEAVRAVEAMVRLERLVMGENDSAGEIGGDFRVEVTLVRAEDRDDRKKRLDRAVLAAAKGEAEAEEQHPGGDHGEREVDADGEARGGDVLS